MGFPRGPLRTPTPPRTRGPVFAVGRRVNITACAEDRTANVTLTDDAGSTPLASLRTGTEVAILAWRPGWKGGARYQVRATDSGEVGWLAASNLLGPTPAVASASATASPRASAAASPAPPVAKSSGRRFGQHN